MVQSLKLLAFDEDDLQVLSTHMQDALMRVEDMVWEPGSNRFVALMNRFDWSGADRVSENETVARNVARCVSIMSMPSG